MKQISQQATVTFSAIEFKDALHMLPLMDALVESINALKLDALRAELPREKRDNLKWISVTRVAGMGLKEAEKVLQVLQNLGFEATVELVEPTREMLQPK